MEKVDEIQRSIPAALDTVQDFVQDIFIKNVFAPQKARPFDVVVVKDGNLNTFSNDSSRNVYRVGRYLPMK